MGDRSIEAQLAALAEATVELDTVWREIVTPGRLGERQNDLVRPARVRAPAPA